MFFNGKEKIREQKIELGQEGERKDGGGMCHLGTTHTGWKGKDPVPFVLLHSDHVMSHQDPTLECVP